MEALKQLLQDIDAKLSHKGEDGQVISITDIFKQFPELATKYQDLADRFKEMETTIRERKWASLPGVEDEKKKFSFLRAFRYIRDRVPLDRWTQAGFEAEIFRNTRAMGGDVDSAGGYLVPAQAVPDFIELLMAEPVCNRMGASVLSGLTGAPVTMPKQTGGATVYWIGENTAITPSDLTFGQLELRPRKAAALVQVANELINRSSPGAETLIRQDLVTQIGVALDNAYLRGAGASGQPLGIANSSGINSVALGTHGAVPEWEKPWVDMEYELAVDKALRGSLGYVFHPALLKALKKARIAQFSGDTGGDFPWLALLIDANLTRINGYPFATTPELPINLTKGNSSNCSEIFFGNWRELLIGIWEGLSIAVSDVAGTAFAADQTWFRIIVNTDCALRHAESFCLCNDARIAAA